MEENKKEELKEKVETKEQEKKQEEKKEKTEKAEANKNKTEEIKKETANTVNQVKDTIKKVDIKKDSIETKGFIGEMFKNPLEKIQEIVNKNTSKYLTYSIIILAIWVIAELVSRSFSFKHIWGFSNVGSALLSILIAGITPIISVLVMSIIIFVVNKNNKKQLTTIITVVIAASIPLVIASVADLITIFSAKTSLVTIPFARLCNVISVVLMYFATKAIFGTEKNSEFIKKFVIIEAIYYIAYLILSLFNIAI